MWTDLSSFYKSKEWTGLKEALQLDRVNTDGDLICEHCGKPIVKAYDCIGHHKTELTLDNVNDCNTSLNPDNISLVHFRCHNIIHNRYGTYTRHIYLVYGCPLSGKTTYTKERAMVHDIVIDIDRIYECISNNSEHIKSKRIADNVFAVRDCLLEQIKTRRGRWVNAWVLGGYPYKGERERIASDIGAELIHIPCDKETALQRLASNPQGRDIAEWTKYIEQYFTRYQE